MDITNYPRGKYIEYTRMNEQMGWTDRQFNNANTFVLVLFIEWINRWDGLTDNLKMLTPLCLFCLYCILTLLSHPKWLTDPSVFCNIISGQHIISNVMQHHFWTTYYIKRYATSFLDNILHQKLCNIISGKHIIPNVM